MVERKSKTLHNGNYHNVLIFFILNKPCFNANFVSDQTTHPNNPQCNYNTQYTYIHLFIIFLRTCHVNIYEYDDLRAT